MVSEAKPLWDLRQQSDASSLSGKKNATSRAAFSPESEAWMAFRSLDWA
jgi:hypothetical protein